MRENGGWFVEICAVSKVSKKEIGRVFKLILKNLETSVELITTGDFMVRPSSIRQSRFQDRYLFYFCVHKTTSLFVFKQLLT